jgi:heptosyltransferase II
MTTAQKVALDRRLGRPLAGLLGRAAVLARRLRGRARPSHPEGPREIVVAKFLGLGNLLHATPLLRALRRRFPAARLTFFTTEGNRALVERLGLVDDALYLDDRGSGVLAISLARALASLWPRRVDFYFDLEAHSALAGALGLLSLARNRLGFQTATGIPKRGLATQVVPFDASAPIRTMFLRLGLAAGAAADGGPPGPLALRPEDASGLAEKAGGWGLDLGEPYLVVNPNASDLSLERRWPLDRFAAAVESLSRAGLRIVVVGARHETRHVAGLLASLSAEVRRGVVDTSGQLTLGELMALIAAASCVITNDSGPMHLAAALERPLVALFGPCTPEPFAVERPEVATLYHRLPCSPCVHKSEPLACGGDNLCMQAITAAEVVAATHRMLAEGSRSVAL